MAIFAELVMHEKQILIVNDINEIDLPDITRQMLVEDYGVKSYLVVPMLYRENIIGNLVLHYVHDYKQFNKDEIDLLTAIANQSAIILYQAKLFNEIQETKNRETLLKTITNEILTSNNIEDTYYEIAAQLAKIFNVDRTALSLYDPVLKKFSNLICEYRKTENVPSVKKMDGYTFTEDFVKLLEEELVEKKNILIIENVNDSKYPEELKQHLARLGAKSTAWVPIIYEDALIGTIFLTNTESYRTWTESEVNFLTSVSKQIAIGINLLNMPMNPIDH